MGSKTPAIEFVCVPLAVLSGVLLAYAMPPNDIGVIGWIALAPLLVASRIMRPVYAAGLGMICAFTSGAILAGGWATVYSQIGNLVGAFGGVGLVLAFACGASSCASRRMSPAQWVIFTACAGVTAEFLSRFAFPVTLAISQHESIAALRIASFTGVWGIAFLLWLAQAGVAALVVRPRAGLVAVGTVAILMSAARMAPAPECGPSIRAAAVQAPGSWDAVELTKRARGARVVVWPEHLMTSAEPAREAARKAGVYIVASIQETAKGKKPYNAAWLIDPAGRRVASVRKQHLFGREQLTYRGGTPSAPADCPGFRPGIAICYDTEFTDVVRGLAARGADIVLIPNHDPQAPNFLFNHLHAAVIPFRAAENGMPIVWSEANGLSRIVAGDGRVIASARAGRQTVIEEDVPLRRGQTIFTRVGDLFAWLCAAVCVILPLMKRGRIRAGRGI